MTYKRRQGRPFKGGAEVGGERIIEAMRAFMRSCKGNNRSISRKSFAEYMEVTPALITYYFPKRSDLIFSATVPVVEGYGRKLLDAVASGRLPRQKLYDIITILVTISLKDKAIFSSYSELISSNEFPNHESIVAQMKNATHSFFLRWFVEEPSHLGNPGFSDEALWSLCEIAPATAETRNVVAVDETVAIRQSATLVYDFIVRGLFGSISSTNVVNAAARKREVQSSRVESVHIVSYPAAAK